MQITFSMINAPSNIVAKPTKFFKCSADILRTVTTDKGAAAAEPSDVDTASIQNISPFAMRYATNAVRGSYREAMTGRRLSVDA